MSKLYLEKFPIVSETGNEYLVTVENTRGFNRTITITIYEPQTKKSIFGRIKDVYKLVAEGYFIEDGVWDYDYRAMAMHEINNYEERLIKDKNHEDKRKEGAYQFEEWDGKE